MTRAENQRIQQIAKQAVSLGIAPADTPVFRADVEFGRAHSMLIWDAIAEIRSGKQAPPPPRNSPDRAVPRRRDPERDLSDDSDDKPERESPEPFENDDDDEAGIGECTCDCEECRDGNCEHCSDPLCRDANCKHADSDDDDFD